MYQVRWGTGHCRAVPGRERRGTVHRMCFVKEYLDGDEWIFKKDEIAGYERVRISKSWF